MSSGHLRATALAFVAILPSALAQQPSDYVIVGRAMSSPGSGGKSLKLFDRRLEPLNEIVDVAGGVVATGPDRSRWATGHPSGLLHLGADAQPLALVAVGSVGMAPAVGADGRLYVGNSTGLTCWTPEGVSVWSAAWPSSFHGRWVAADGQGQVHVGGTGPDVFFWGGPSELLRFSASDGALLGTLLYPPDNPVGGHSIQQVRVAPDGTVWCNDGMYNPEPIYYLGAKLIHTSRESLIGSLPYGLYGEMGLTNPIFCVDALGRLLVPDFEQLGVVSQPETTVLRYDPAQPGAPLAAWDLGEEFYGFELGVTGEELFAVTLDDGVPLRTDRLVRLNLVSGVRSSIVVGQELPWGSGGGYHWLLLGDPTGFVLANATDRAGDADGDGSLNGDETTAGSNPFDPESRPDGPKVYVSFAPGTNAIAMTLFDPDGLRHPTKGIDFATMSVTIGGSGNVFWPLLALVTEASLSADGKTAHAVFGGLPLASDLKLRVEMTVRDRTGAVGWDWQATPPGDL